MNPRKAIGPALVIILLIGVSLAINYSFRERRAEIAGQHSAAHITVKILSGSEKERFLSDLELIRVLGSERIDITVQKAGSREIATRPALKTSDIAYPAVLTRR